MSRGGLALGGQGLVAAGQGPEGTVGRGGRVGAGAWLLDGQLVNALGRGQRIELGAEFVGGGDQQVAELVGGLGAGLEGA
jgi:hypothetical protein